MGRIFDIKLKCGCMLSSDGGGALLPCHYDDEDKKQIKLCNKSWKEWKKTKQYKQFHKEVKEKNE